MEKNFERMVRLAEEFFETKQDPSQISVDENVLQRLRTIHPRTLSEERNADGPIAWILVFPTTRELMEKFIAKTISERDLLWSTPLRSVYETLYLCSALVLPEFRGKGLAARLTRDAIAAIQKDHPL